MYEADTMRFTLYVWVTLVVISIQLGFIAYRLKRLLKLMTIWVKTDVALRGSLSIARDHGIGAFYNFSDLDERR